MGLLLFDLLDLGTSGFDKFCDLDSAVGIDHSCEAFFSVIIDGHHWFWDDTEDVDVKLRQWNRDENKVILSSSLPRKTLLRWIIQPQQAEDSCVND